MKIQINNTDYRSDSNMAEIFFNLTLGQKEMERERERD